jgi:phospholipid/cholesterol/gamma-HCH transport system ATP-binding protein
VSATQPIYDVDAVKVNKTFGTNHVLRDMTLQVVSGETFVIVGPSGSGKSVFLKHIVGLLAPDSGSVHVLGKDMRNLPPDELLPLRRQIGLVFQSSALLNSLTVEENVALGLVEHDRMPYDQVRVIVNEKLAQVEMAGTNDLLPEQLSGGMKKRVAVARTLALGPRMMLFDEPTVGLDPLLSTNVDDLIVGLKKNMHCTSIVVTHDLITAFRVADRIGMFHDGKIIAINTPELFLKSPEPVVREFLARNVNWRF